MFNRCATLQIDLDILKSTPEDEVVHFDHMGEPDLSQLAAERAQRLEDAKANILAPH